MKAFNPDPAESSFRKPRAKRDTPLPNHLPPGQLRDHRVANPDPSQPLPNELDPLPPEPGFRRWT